MANRSNSPRAPRRRTHWSELASTTFDISAGGAVLMGSSIVRHEGETLVRTRGIISVTLLTAASVGDGFIGAFGMVLVTTAAATAGVGSIPTPFTEAAWDGWFVHRYFDVRSGLAADGSGQVRLEIDSKAMRKANEDESIVLVSETVETGTATAKFTGRIRLLSMAG